MQLTLKLAWLTAVVASSLQALKAQDLAPRAYVITPLHANAITLNWSFYDGSINFNVATIRMLRLPRNAAGSRDPTEGLIP